MRPMFSNNSPLLNLHGETRDTCVFLIEDFIRDNVIMGNLYIGVIHGRSSNILKNKVHEVLKRNKYVDSFKIDIFNPGVTIIKLKVK